MVIFLESPWPILLLGLAVEAVLGVMLFSTGRGKLLWAMLATAAVTLAGLVVERMVVTDREAITNTIDGCAAAVEANDLNRLLGYVAPNATELQGYARYELGRVEFTKARIINLDIKINKLTNPPTAKVRFRVMGSAKDRKGEFVNPGFDVSGTIELQRRGDRWLVTACKPETQDLR
jgi:hypothetical protein